MRTLTVPCLLLGLAAMACGGQDVRSSTSTTTGGGGEGAAGGNDAYPCPPGERLVDDTCLPAGLPPEWSTPGPAFEPEPGVPADGCGDGFVHDGLGGCEAILPGTPCTGAEMAVPGDASCHPIADCGTGTWGAIPVDPTTVYVDQSFGGVPDGSAAAPYPTVQSAVDAAPGGATIAVAAGTYVEDIAVDGKSVAIWGRCPDQVTLVGVDAPGAVTLQNAPGAELHNVAVTGGRAGVLAIDSAGAVLTHLHVHDLPEPGIAATGPPPAVTLVDSLIVDVGFYGAVSQGALTVTGCEVRTTQPTTTMHGLGCYVSSASADRLPSLEVDRSFIHHAHVLGIVALSADVAITRTVIADTNPLPGDDRGWAIVASDQDGPPAAMTVSQTVMARNTDSNVRVFGSSVSLDAVTIEDGLANGEGYGVAVSIENGVADPSIMGETTLTRSVIRDMARLGLEAYHGSITADRVLVQRVSSSIVGGPGRGIFLGWSPDGSGSSTLLLERSIIEQTTKESLLALGSTVVVRDSILRDVGGARDGELAVGVSIGIDPDWPLTPSDVLLERATVASVSGIGVFNHRSKVSLRDTIVSGHDVLGVEGISGVGLFATHDGGESAGTVDVDGCLFDDNGSRGIVTQGGTLELANTLVRRTRADDPSQIGNGRGVEVQGGSATIVATEIADASSAGLFVASASTEVAGLFVHDVGVDAKGAEGFGIAVVSPFVETATVGAIGGRIERVHTMGVLVDGSSAELVGTVVTDVAGDLEGRFGRGIGSQGQDSWLRVVDCLVDDVAESGISLLHGSGEIVDATVRRVRAADDDGLLGDGILLIHADSVMVRGCQVQDVARAAFSSFASVVTLADNDLRCNELPLVTEPLGGVPSQLQDAGGNLCGCADEATCKAVSAGLTPPEALPPTMEGSAP